MTRRTASGETTTMYINHNGQWFFRFKLKFGKICVNTIANYKHILLHTFFA